MTISLRQRVIDTFKEYGGWWKLGGMAEWLGVSEQSLERVWKKLEEEGLLERKRYSRKLTLKQKR